MKLYSPRLSRQAQYLYVISYKPQARGNTYRLREIKSTPDLLLYHLHLIKIHLKERERQRERGREREREKEMLL